MHTAYQYWYKSTCGFTITVVTFALHSYCFCNDDSKLLYGSLVKKVSTQFETDGKNVVQGYYGGYGLWDKTDNIQFNLNDYELIICPWVKSVKLIYLV